MLVLLLPTCGGLFASVRSAAPPTATKINPKRRPPTQECSRCITKDGDDPLELDPKCGLSALHAAALHGDDTLMTLLLSHPAVTPDILQTHLTNHGQSVLDIVLSHRNTEAGIKLASFMGLKAFEGAAADGRLGSRACVRVRVARVCEQLGLGVARVCVSLMHGAFPSPPLGLIPELGRVP